MPNLVRGINNPLQLKGGNNTKAVEPGAKKVKESWNHLASDALLYNAITINLPKIA